MYHYRPVKQFLAAPELGDYMSFGIHIFAVTSSGCTEAGFISDVSCDSDFVADLADRCTQLQLDPGHLLDVVLDSIR